MRRYMQLFVMLLTIGASAVACRAAHDVAPSSDAPDSVRLYDNLGSYHRGISTTVPAAQSYFDQGLRLTYAFNHEEAIRAFERATVLDSTCAICYWGIAFAYGPNINAPMDSASGVLAFNAVRKAVTLSPHASEVERALIDATSRRYAEVPPADRAALDQAFAAAMKEVKSKYPNDLDVLTIHAEAVMNLSPWDYWSKDGTPKASTAEILTDLERVLATNADHPGACHYYIHAVEAAQPGKAVACSERLAALMPGAGHLVHMPAHIYIRVGRWTDAITANEHAVHSDSSYLADRRPSGIYPIAYYPHNFHFLSFASTMAGRADLAIRAARSVTEKLPVDVVRQIPPVEPLMPHLVLTLVTFGRWDDVLKEPTPPSDLRVATALSQYARGVAFAAKGDSVQAKQALDTVRAIVSATQDPLTKSILDVAHHALAGETALRSRDLKGAEAHFRQAMAAEDGLPYMEPPHWYYPIRHSLGSVLLQQGRAAEAERLYREDLVRFPDNVWSLKGLSESLTAQKKTAEAAEVGARIAKLQPDTPLSASRM